VPFGLEPAWIWIVAGLLLAGCELLAPGAFLFWVGLAAIATGLALSAVPMAWEFQVLAFAVLAGVSVLIGRRVARSPVPNLNRRGHSLVGQCFTLEAPITSGVGRLQLGDTSWRIAGPNLPAGASIRVLALDGSTLVIGPAEPSA
jgi:inner membrane protein